MNDGLAADGDPSLVGPDVIVAVAEAKRGRKQPQAGAPPPVENKLSLGVVGDGLAEIEPGSDHREVSESGGWDEPDRALSFPAGFTPFPAPLSPCGPPPSRPGPVCEAPGAPHPRRRTDRAHPVGEGRDEAEVPRARRC